MTAITYYIVPANGSLEMDGIQLTARTDRGARIQAKKLGLAPGYSIWFFRASDGCKGAIEV